MKRNSLRGFTLLELLVAISIAAVLATLTTSGIANAARKAKQLQCSNNLHQYGIALHSFVQDYSVYPLVRNPGFTLGIAEDHDKTLWAALSKYGLGPMTDRSPSVHVCPAAAGQKPPVTTNATRSLTSYAYNSFGMGRRGDTPLGLGGVHVVGANLVTPVPESDIARPSSLIAMGDGARGWNKTYEDGVGFLSRTPEAKEYDGSTPRVTTRHKGRLLILFTDGTLMPFHSHGFSKRAPTQRS